MTKFLSHKEIDKTRWDECIENSINALIYANSWYLDVACPGWNAIVIDDYKAVCPLPVKEKLNIKYIYPPFFIQQLGLFYTDKKYNNPECILSCISNIPSQFKYIELFLNECNELKGSNEKQIKKRKNYLLKLDKPYEVSYNNYNHGLKANLKKAAKNTLLMKKSDDIEMLISLFKEYKGNELNKFNKGDYERLKKLAETCIKKKCAEIFFIYKGDELVAGSIFLFYKNRITYFFSASSEKGRKLSGMSIILDNIIKKYSNTDYILDFEGSMIESIASYFKSFDATECLYLHLKINRLPWLIRWLKD